MEQGMTTKEDGRAAPRIRNQEAIAARYGQPWREVVRLLYFHHDSIEGVVTALGISKPTLYRWINREQLAEWKRQHRAATIAYLKNPARALLDEE
jgi:DNA invertase Pin-like site-specific DNA recombinase